MNNDEQFVLIDVREPYEHQEFNIGGQLIPMSSLPNAIADLADSKDKEVILYCRSGSRSGMAQQFLQQNGFKNVWNLTGGMLAWADAFGTSK
ncbi:MAG: rhodanese-like domain-containing protein [Saprospiraceae bacterium]|nr:rhodanese-like domain-containing protein [Saprospiraceae bacterium]